MKFMEGALAAGVVVDSTAAAAPASPPGGRRQGGGAGESDVAQFLTERACLLLASFPLLVQPGLESGGAEAAHPHERLWCGQPSV